jgi:hypothetical protein
MFLSALERPDQLLDQNDFFFELVNFCVDAQESHVVFNFLRLFQKLLLFLAGQIDVFVRVIYEVFQLRGIRLELVFVLAENSFVVFERLKCLNEFVSLLEKLFILRNCFNIVFVFQTQFYL